MAEFVYGVNTFERKRGDFPELPVVNLLAEEVPVEPGVALQSRPGLETTVFNMGNRPVEGLYQEDGVLGGELYGVSNRKLYKGNTMVGAIDGNGPVSFDGYEDSLFVNAGRSIWRYNGANVFDLAFPDDAEVCKILVAASRLVAVRKNTGTFYWTGPLGVLIDGLSFATAESSPDRLKDALFIGDRLYLFGAETVEIWVVSEDPDLPFAPLVGAVFPVGIKETGAATQFGSTFAWITNNNEVCMGDPDSIISDPELQVQIAASTSQKLWTFYVDDNEFLAVQLNNQTWVYGYRSQVWSRFESYPENNWVCQTYAGGYFGLSTGGNLAQFSSNSYEDFGGPIERRFRAWAPITSESINLANVILRTNPGTTPFTSGSYTNPTVEMRTSRDGGNQWQPFRQRSMGRQGQYRRKTIWSSLGLFGYPGALVEFRNSDPVPFRVSGVAYNEPFGGR